MPSVDDFLPAEELTPTKKALPKLEGDFPPTEEQAAIVDAVRYTDRNLLISALAGAAKTSTLVLIARAMPTTAMLCLAFNKKIATEMSQRLPSTCVAKTLNSLGHMAWTKFLNKRFLEVDTKKTFTIVKTLIEEINDAKAKGAMYKSMSEIIRAVDEGKTSGYIPEGHYPHARPLMSDDDFFESLDEAPDDDMKEIIVVATLRSLALSHQGIIDFNDQILMPTVFPVSFSPQYPITLVDEAQDLSALNHVMLSKVVGKKRLIAVGDECQSIYGFRGAHQDSMRMLKQKFDMEEFLLTTSFRCPVKVVEEARWRAPHMRYPEWAQPGEVKHFAEWDITDIPDHGVILCRNNAPLFSMAVKLLKAGRYPELVGSDIGKAILKTLKGLGKLETKRAEVLALIDMWAATKKEKSRKPAKIDDQADCMKIFAEQGATLGDAIAYCDHLLSVAGPIKLMTGHKSKGLEFDHIFILDQSLLSDHPQDRNLRYVMQTRAKRSLSYLQSKLFDDPKKEQVNDEN